MVRHKNRYFVIKIEEIDATGDGPLYLHPANLYGAITGVIQQVHGDFGVAATKSGLVAKYCNSATKIGIIRCRHGPHKLLASAIPYVKYIGPYKATISSLFMGATMRHCFNYIKRYQQKKFDEYCLQVTTDEEKAELKKMLLNMNCVSSIL